ncbi:hypothetical protein M0G74_08770 [Microbulbifer sp. CAU 1566]|uniref:hypothetical protein n=1 Tax=Microbulbifer sp. CAU 1566 TaxID=2933269 RepID=UPI002003D620|nr:hypothetical protein [Microbulbifer sp. CAU 1566]MCK7597362.1 hypothetical protein [Microbulbifer sp. CAU 1566]
MKSIVSTKVVVMDPGLIAPGGHHTGFAYMAAQSRSDRELPIELEFVCSHCVDVVIKEKIEEFGCRVRPEFFINFYELFANDDGSAESQTYIRQASREYYEAICNTEKPAEGQALIFFHPCVSWEHAVSLSLALRLHDGQEHALHIICAMFNPGIRHNGKTLSQSSKMQFGMAFRALEKNRNARVFASDFELAEKYARLLDRQVLLDIHPCYLADWEKIAQEKRKLQYSNKPSKTRILLYFGDAKVDKGFTSLPELVRNILADCESPIELNIHFNNPWDAVDLQEVTAELKDIAAIDDRLNLIEKFLSDDDLHLILHESDLILLNYDSSIYMEKSSGVLWLAAYHSLPVCILQNSWLRREAFRLGVQTVDFKDLNSFIEETVSMCGMKQRNEATDAQLQYRKTIYQPFWSWLFKVGKSDNSGKNIGTHHVELF